MLFNCHLFATFTFFPYPTITCAQYTSLKWLYLFILIYFKRKCMSLVKMDHEINLLNKKELVKKKTLLLHLKSKMK